MITTTRQLDRTPKAAANSTGAQNFDGLEFILALSALAPETLGCERHPEGHSL